MKIISVQKYPASLYYVSVVKDLMKWLSFTVKLLIVPEKVYNYFGQFYPTNILNKIFSISKS